MPSDFWAKRLGQQQAPAQPVAQQPTGPWWAPPQPQVQQPVQPQVQAPVQPTVDTSQQYSGGTPGDGGEQHFGDLLRQDEYTTTKAQSAKDDERCPDCGGPNYVRSSQSPNSMKSCFDCGYNPRFLHSTHGATGIGQNDLPTFTARSQTQQPPGAPPRMSIIAHI